MDFRSPKVFLNQPVQQLFVSGRCADEIQLKECQKRVPFRYAKLPTLKRAFFPCNLGAAALILEIIGITLLIVNPDAIFIAWLQPKQFHEENIPL